jgi:hypothetical protein
VNHARFGKQDVWNPVFIILGWTLYGVFFAAQNYVQQSYLGKNANWQNNLATWLICAYSWALLTPLILVLATRFPPTLKNWRRCLMVHVPAAVTLSFFQLALYLIVWQSIYGPKPGGPFEQYKNLVVEEFHAGILIYISILAINFVRVFLSKSLEDSRIPRMNGIPAEKSDDDQILSSTNGNGVDTKPFAGFPLYVTRILVKENGRIIFVKPNDIDWINSEGNYVKLHTRARRYLVRETMNAMEQKLNPSAFVRIRRSTIVRVEQITELRPAFNGGFKVVLKDGTILDASRRYRKILETILKFKVHGRV